MDLRAHYLEHGFVLIRGGIPPSLLAELRRDLAPVLARRGDGTTSGQRHQTLLEAASFRPSLLAFLNLDALNRAAEAICATSELVCWGVAAQLGYPRHAFCGWHRDFADADPETPALIAQPDTHVQTNCALHDDPALWIIPGSHRRATTDAERAHLARLEGLPFIADAAEVRARHPDPLAGMPGAAAAPLRAGDCLLYNAMMFHAAEYRPELTRVTLHGGWTRFAAADAWRACRWGVDKNPYLLGETPWLGDRGPWFGPQSARMREIARRHRQELLAKAG